VKQVTLERVDQVRLEAIAKDHHELIRSCIPTLAFGLVIGKVADIEEQDFKNRVIVGEYFAVGDIFTHL
jgi:hypothetical protein